VAVEHSTPNSRIARRLDGALAASSCSLRLVYLTSNRNPEDPPTRNGPLPSERNTDDFVGVFHANHWPAEAVEMWHAIAEDFAEAAPPLPRATRFEVDDSDLPRGLAARMLDTAMEYRLASRRCCEEVAGPRARAYFSRAATALSAARVISAPAAEQTRSHVRPPRRSSRLRHCLLSAARQCFRGNRCARHCTVSFWAPPRGCPVFVAEPGRVGPLPFPPALALLRSKRTGVEVFTQ
jgi:hypothetical protein